MEPTHPPPHEEARFAPLEGPIKSETTPTDSPPLRNLNSAPPASKSPSQPIPSTEIGETADMGIAGPKGKKKGTATVAKKAPKRPRPSGAKKAPKKAKPSEDRTDATPSDPMGDDGSEAESDNGPYCICRGPDDHRWMIFCERCEDWFHGECINLDKGIGESLIEKFICPNCTNGKLTTLYKKTCAMGACRKPARLSPGEQQSVFCSDEHAQIWWERIVSRLPKGKGKTRLNDQLTQGEFIALLSSGMASVDEDGLLKLVKIPFHGDLPKLPNGDETGNDGDISQILTEEERSLLDSAGNARYHLAQETILCNHMITLVELAQKRRRAAIDAGRFGDDVCGYDSRLDSVSARDAFAAFVKSPEGEAILKSEQLGPPPRKDGVGGDDGNGGDDDDDDDGVTRGMCERKRCKAHAGWQKMLVLGIKYRMREMAGQAAEVSEEERVVMEAAGERWRRKRAEKNWVEVVND